MNDVNVNSSKPDESGREQPEINMHDTTTNEVPITSDDSNPDNTGLNIEQNGGGIFVDQIEYIQSLHPI